MLTCLSRSVSVRSHGRLASLKHPVLSPPPLWNTPNKTPPKSTTNSYSLKLLPSFLPSFFPFPSIPQPPFSAKSVQISSVPFRISIVRFRPRRCPLSLFLPHPSSLISHSHTLTLSLFFMTCSCSLHSLNCFPFFFHDATYYRIIFFSPHPSAFS